MRKYDLIKLLVFLCCGLLMIGCRGKSVDRLLQEGKVEAAARRCEKMQAGAQAEGFKKIAAFYLENEQYKKAAAYYAKAGEHNYVINSYFLGDMIPAAETYCAGQTGEAKKQCAARLANKFLINGNYQKALGYYKMAGNSQKVLYIETKTPIFQLVDELEKKTQNEKDPGFRTEINHLKELLTDYLIHTDSYRAWKYARAANPDKEAAAACEKAWDLVENSAVPAVVNRLTTPALAGAGKDLESLSFHRLKLESLLQLIKGLHKIAGQRKFFTTYSVVYLDKTEKAAVPPGPAFNYEEAYLAALESAQTLLQAIVESNHPKNKNDTRDYREEIAIDAQTIDYIASMMNNIVIRMNDILLRSQKPGKNSDDKTLKDASARQFRDFSAVCHRVLHAVGKGEYQEANDLLIAGYETAKNHIDRIASQEKQPPAAH
jgi:hypothetical protein